MKEQSEGGPLTDKSAGVQFPTPGRIVHVFPNGDTKGHPCAGVVARMFNAGDAFSTLNVGGWTPEADFRKFTSVQHATKASKGEPCWDWPARA